MGGEVDKMKGRVKQAAGDLTNNKHLKAEGKIDVARGTVKDKIDQAANAIKKQV